MPTPSCTRPGLPWKSTRDRSTRVRPSASSARSRALAAARDGDDHLRIRECYDELSQITEPFARRIMDVALREAVEGRSLEEL